MYTKKLVFKVKEGKKHIHQRAFQLCVGGPSSHSTVGTKIIADPEKCFQELISEKLLILLRERPRLELIIVSSNFQALLFWQDKLLESV